MTVDAAPPPWAEMLGADGYQVFRRELIAALARARLELDAGHLDCGVLHTRAGTIGLENLVRLCHAADAASWPDLIADHLRRCTAEPASIDFERAAPRLRLRLVPDRHVAMRPDGYVARPLAAGLQLALALDNPEHVVFVHPRELVAWARSEDDLVELAREHTRAEPPLADEAIEVPDGPTLHFLSGESYFAASQVLFLDRQLAPCANGHLVALPDRHTVIALALDASAALGGLGPLVRIAHAQFAEAPGKLTDQLYWRRGPDELVRVACGVNADGAPWVAPPDAFNAMVQTLR